MGSVGWDCAGINADRRPAVCGKTGPISPHLRPCAGNGTGRPSPTMATQLLIDTDVLIDYLRNDPKAVSYVEAQQERFLISVVAVAKLYAGVR